MSTRMIPRQVSRGWVAPGRDVCELCATRTFVGFQNNDRQGRSWRRSPRGADFRADRPRMGSYNPYPAGEASVSERVGFRALPGGIRAQPRSRSESRIAHTSTRCWTICRTASVRRGFRRIPNGFEGRHARLETARSASPISDSISDGPRRTKRDPCEAASATLSRMA